MNTTLFRFIIMGILFLIIFISGFWLHNSGKPFGVVIFNAHKLLALAACIIFAVIVIKVHRVNPLTPLQITVIAANALFSIAAIVTGGLLSIEKSMPLMVLRLHQIAPPLIVLCSATALYLLLIARNSIPAV